MKIADRNVCELQYKDERCPHKFHIDCIQKWSKEKNECPACRKRFDTIVPCTKDDPPVPVAHSDIKVDDEINTSMLYEIRTAIREIFDTLDGIRRRRDTTRRELLSNVDHLPLRWSVLRRMISQERRRTVVEDNRGPPTIVMTRRIVTRRNRRTVRRRLFFGSV